MGDENGNSSAYSIGYGKPPTQHRFKPGQSGNPRGRPKRAKSQHLVDTRRGMQPVDEYIRLETSRLLPIREGDKVIHLPAMQVMIRAMLASAIKGNRFMQRELTQLVMSRELADLADRKLEFDNAIGYKQNWDSAIQQARAAGQPEPTPVPHPDDIIIDPNTCFVTIRGPRTPEEKANHDEALAMRAQAQIEVNRAAQKFRRARNETTKARWREEWHWQQQLFDVINDTVPPRYRTELENRSWHPDATRPGTAVEELKRRGVLP